PSLTSCNDTELTLRVSFRPQPEPTPINSVGLHDLQHRIALLEAENDGLKGAVKARDEHIDSLRQAMQLLEHKHEPSSPPHSPWWKFWKKS
ncbi:DNA-binding protein, partial [Klebsiella pneumoniae]